MPLAMLPRPIGLPSPDANVHDRHAILPGFGVTPLRSYEQDVSRVDTPVVLHFHAGAFVKGSLADGAAVAGTLQAAGAIVVSVDYPLAPTHPFPRAAETGYAALQWVHRQRRTLGNAHAPIYVAGEEAGGNLAAAVAMIARDRAGPELAGTILLSPMLDMCVATASQRDAHAGPVGCAYADGWRAYLARDDDAIHPYAVPGRALRLAGLPRCLLITAADDPLRDETQAFATRLREAGVAAQLHQLDAPTGWPRRYREPAGDWSERLQDPLHQFLHPSSRGSRA